MSPQTAPVRSRCWTRGKHVPGVILAAALLAALIPSPLCAQPGLVPNGYGGLIIADRNQTRVLREAQDLIANQQYADALNYLQKLLEQDQDQLLRPKPDDAGGAFQSLKSEVYQIIEHLPPDGREVYLRNYGPLADVLLKEAIEQNDADKLAEVARLYYHTPAGYEATYRIGLRHFDHGEPMAAALIFQRLKRTPDAAKRWEPMLSLRIGVSWLRAGMPEEARKVLESLSTPGKEKRVVLAGQERELFAQDGKPADWLSDVTGNQPAAQIASNTDWLIPRAAPSRNAILPIPNPAKMEPWQINTVFYHPFDDDPLGSLETDVDRELQAIVPLQRRDRTGKSLHLLPSHRPLVVRGSVVARMLVKMRAYDLDTGDFATEMFSWDRALDGLTGTDGQPRIPNSELLLAQWMNQRLWDDNTNGQLSSDGQRLYSIEDTGFWANLPSHGKREPIPVSPANLLMAYDLTSGLIDWEVGGTPDQPQRRLEGRYFLGPPLPMAGQLFCLVDYNNEVQLNVLNAATGDLEWSQPLAASSAQSITQDRERRTSGVSVAYADGILVCPTDTGATVALDLTTRSLLWGLPTETGNAQQFNPQGRFRGGRIPNPMSVLPSGWVDSTPTIAQGKVALTPLKSSKLFLLDLRTGKRIWEQPRGQGLYVAGIVNQMVVVVGRTNVQTWNVNNDQTGWENPLSLSSAPTGRGVIVGTNLLLPAGKEILVVDLKQGKVERKIPAPQGVTELGNLALSQGRLISQSVDTLCAFPFPELDE